MTQEEETARVRIENRALRVILTILALGIDSGKNPDKSPSQYQTLLHIGESLSKGMEDSSTIFPNGGKIFMEIYRKLSEEFLGSQSLPPGI